MHLQFGFSQPIGQHITVTLKTVLLRALSLISRVVNNRMKRLLKVQNPFKDFVERFF